MIKNNVYYEWFASITVPNPDQVGYWVDLGTDSKGRIIKVYNHDIEKWIVLFDVSKDDYVPPFIGSNGNWWVDNRDTGVKATAETPYIGENDHWFTYDPINKVYVDTGIEARGLSAYDIAVKLGFEGSEQDWIDSLSKASEDAAVAALDAANKANEAADKANQAVTDIEGIVDDAIAATDKAEEIASNPPKIVDNDWWIYDYDTKQYVNTGISAIGGAFTYKKEYPSVEAMEADWGTADVKLGEYVLINTNDVEDPDDAKVYLKTQEGWKFIVDLSGMQGIQGWSAYEVAVKHGFVGTEAEWVQSLKQPALDAAAEALEAKAQVEATEKAVKEAEALRVTAEQGRVNAENTRVRNENTRISNEDSRKAEEAKRVTAENARIAAETSRKEAESSRVNAESDRVEAEGARAAAEQLRANSESERNTKEKERIANEAIRVASESERVTAETSRKEEEAKRVEAETARDTAEQERESNEATRQANEAIRETQEAAREKNTSDAITAVNEAKTAAQQATTNATTAANNANTQAARAKEYADNPPKVGDDGYWYLWDEVNDVYVNTGWPSSGIILKGRLNSPEELGDIVDPQLSDSYIVGTDLYFWNGIEWVNMGRFQGPQGEPGKDAELSKAAIEAVLVGEVTTHTHDTRYVKKTGDTMTGSLNVTVSDYNSEISLDGMKLETSRTSTNAKGLFYKNFDKTGYLGGIGMISTGNGSTYTTSRAYIGWGNSPWEDTKNLAISENQFTYKNNNIWHAGNDGSGSGLDADLLDGCQLVTVGDATGPHSVFSRPSIGNYRRFWHIGNLPTVAATSTGESKVVFHVCGLVNFGTTEEIYATITASTRGSIAVRVINHIGNAAQYQVGYVATDSEVQIWIANSENYGGTSSLDICVSKGFTLVNSTQTTEPENIVYANINRVVTTSNLEDTLAYWYENNENASSTTCLTGGNRNVIESLKSKFKRCIAKPYGDDAALISYLNEIDSNKWPDGTGATYNHVKKESLMVHFPKYYHKTIERSPGIWRTYISEQQIDSDYIEEPELLLGTFEGIISDDNGGALTSSGSSISTASKTIAQFVAAAKVNGSMYGICDYRSHATIARMFCAYYKTTNISTSNSAIPCSGGTKRYNYGWTGGTKTLGNRDGKAAVNNDTGYYSTNFLGLEDCYYSKWEFVQGINILKGKYVVYDGGSFPDKDVAELEAAGATNIRVAGYEPNPAATGTYNGWTKAVAQGKYGDVVPTALGGSETTYYSDYSWFNPTGNRIFLRSGRSDSGSLCGVFVAHADYESSSSFAYFGARLAFYGKIVVVDSDTFKKMQA